LGELALSLNGERAQTAQSTEHKHRPARTTLWPYAILV
jgi:hypothetical protein